MNFNEDIIITDPCYFKRKDDTNFSTSTLPRTFFKNYLTTNTMYGDWKCTVFELGNTFKNLHEFLDNVHDLVQKDESSVKKLNKLGTFTSDGGKVCVAAFKDVLKYNPDFVENIPKTCYSVIQNFKGEIGFYDIRIGSREQYMHTKRIVYGLGNRTFFSLQTKL